MVDINLTDPRSSQILVYNELLASFENVDLTSDIIKDFEYVEKAANIGNGAFIYNDNVGGTLRFKGLKGSNGIKVIDEGRDVNIEFNGDALTLSGLGRDGFLQVSNNLNDVDPLQARSNLEVLSVQQSHDSFLEANASNIPDNDNHYDLGSNGRRFANMFAVTFHGNATSASLAYGLDRNSAGEGDILVWRNAENKWVAEEPLVNTLKELSDVDLTGLLHETVLVFNGVRNKWEPVPISIFGGGDDDGSLMLVENIGDGVGIYSSTLGNALMMRSISSSNDKVHIDTNFNGDEITIDVDVPLSTSDLPEGSNRYYRTEHFLSDLEGVSLQDLGNVDKDISPSPNQAPVWNGNLWEWRTVSIDLTSTDVLNEGSTNLYFTDSRARNSIDGYFNDGLATLRKLGDTNITNPSNADVLVYNINSAKWDTRKLTILEMADVNANNISSGQGLVWDGVKFNNFTMPITLDDLGENSNSLHFNQSSFDSMFAGKSTLDFAESQHEDYLLLNTINLESTLPSVSISALGDVDTTDISDGSILVWDAGRNEFVSLGQENLTVSVSMSIGDLTDVDSQSVNNIQDNQVLSYNQNTGLFIATDTLRNIRDADDVVSSGLNEGTALVWKSDHFEPENVVTFQDTLSNNDFLMFDSIANTFKPVNRDSLVEGIGSLGDVSLFNIQGNDILSYNGTTERFENIPNTIANLSDVNTTDISDGDVLVYNSSNSEFVPSAISTSLIGLTDTDLDSISNNQSIKWDGNSFVPANYLEFVGSASEDNELLYYSITDNSFIAGHYDNALNIDTTNKATNSFLRWNGTRIDYARPSFNDLLDIDTSVSSTGQMVLVPEETGDGGYIFSLEEVSIPQTINELADLSDVSNDAPSDGQILIYDSSVSRYVPRDPETAPATVSAGIYERTTANGQTVFNNIPHTGNVLVWANGILMPRSEVITTNLDVIELVTERDSGDNIRIMVLNDPDVVEPTVGGMRGEDFEMVAGTGGQQTFTFEHEDVNVMVWVSGVLYNTNQYTLTPFNNTITFNTPITEGLVVRILKLV